MITPYNSIGYLWEILVPYHDNEGVPYHIVYHKKWDEMVRGIAGGLTIFKTSKGQWVGNDSKLFIDKMIPVRIYCTEFQIDKIIDFTMTHYDQEAILCYRISDLVKLVNRKK